MQIIKVEKISTGIRLKQLIKEKGLSNKQFVKQFNLWLRGEQAKGKYVGENAEPEIKEKDLSRWTRETNPVQMRKDKVEMFADFFDVDVDYLSCKQIEKSKSELNSRLRILDQSADLQTLRDQLKTENKRIKIVDLLKGLGYTIIDIPSKIEENDNFQFIDGDKLVTATESYLTEQEYRIIDMDGVTRIFDVKTLCNNIEKYIKFEVSLLEPVDNNSQND